VDSYDVYELWRDQFGMVPLSGGNALAFAGCAGGCLGPNILGQGSQVSDPLRKFTVFRPTVDNSGHLSIQAVGI